MDIRPIGTVRSELKKPTLLAEDDDLTLHQRLDEARTLHQRINSLTSELVLNPECEPLLDGIEGFSHVVVLYWPHLIKTPSTLTKIHPMGRKEFPLTGVLATCSPSRPNPVLVSAVRLLERRGAVLRVQGLEAVDGSPVIDVKPYNPGYLRVEDPVVPDWMARIQGEMDRED